MRRGALFGFLVLAVVVAGACQPARSPSPGVTPPPFVDEPRVGEDEAGRLVEDWLHSQLVDRLGPYSSPEHPWEDVFLCFVARPVFPGGWEPVVSWSGYLNDDMQDRGILGVQDYEWLVECVPFPEMSDSELKDFADSGGMVLSWEDVISPCFDWVDQQCPEVVRWREECDVEHIEDCPPYPCPEYACPPWLFAVDARWQGEPRPIDFAVSWYPATVLPQRAATPAGTQAKPPLQARSPEPALPEGAPPTSPQEPETPTPPTATQPESESDAAPRSVPPQRHEDCLEACEDSLADCLGPYSVLEDRCEWDRSTCEGSASRECDEAATSCVEKCDDAESTCTSECERRRTACYSDCETASDALWDYCLEACADEFDLVDDSCLDECLLEEDTDCEDDCANYSWSCVDACTDERSDCEDECEPYWSCLAQKKSSCQANYEDCTAELEQACRDEAEACRARCS